MCIYTHTYTFRFNSISVASETFLPSYPTAGLIVRVSHLKKILIPGHHNKHFLSFPAAHAFITCHLSQGDQCSLCAEQAAPAPPPCQLRAVLRASNTAARYRCSSEGPPAGLVLRTVFLLLLGPPQGT